MSTYRSCPDYVAAEKLVNSRKQKNKDIANQSQDQMTLNTAHHKANPANRPPNQPNSHNKRNNTKRSNQQTAVRGVTDFTSRNQFEALASTDEGEAAVSDAVTTPETQQAQTSTNLICNANNPQLKGNHNHKAKRTKNQNKALARARNLIAKAEAADLAEGSAQAEKATTPSPVQALTLSEHTNTATPINTQIKEVATSANANSNISNAVAESTPEASAGVAIASTVQSTTTKPGITVTSTGNSTCTDTINLQNNLITTLNTSEHQTISLTEWVMTMLKLFTEVLSVPENQRWGKLMTGFMILAPIPRA